MMDYTPPPYVEECILSEIPCPVPVQDMVRDSLKDIPQKSVFDEIEYVAKAFKLDPVFMMTVAEIESDFNPKNQTGQYKGLYQLSTREFNRYGHKDWDIWNARDNAIAAAYKIKVEAIDFEHDIGRPVLPFDMYMVHQQGEEGALEHMLHPEQPAWANMCLTDEGKEKGISWCKKAIWGNTLPAIKAVVKSVDNFTSAQFLEMWKERMAKAYLKWKFKTKRFPFPRESPVDPYNGYNGPWGPR